MKCTVCHRQIEENDEWGNEHERHELCLVAKASVELKPLDVEHFPIVEEPNFKSDSQIIKENTEKKINL